jgi:hypothetical protein
MPASGADKQYTDFKTAVLAASGDPAAVPPPRGHLELSQVRGYTSHSKFTQTGGRAIAQAVSRRVRAQVRSCAICGGRSGTGAGFLRVLRFPLPTLIIMYHPGLVQ